MYFGETEQVEFDLGDASSYPWYGQLAAGLAALIAIAIAARYGIKLVQKLRAPQLLVLLVASLALLSVGCGGTMFQRQYTDAVHRHLGLTREAIEALYQLGGDRIPESIKLRNATWLGDYERDIAGNIEKSTE